MNIGIEQSLAIIGINENLIIVLIVFLLLFGGQKIPQLMRGLGKGMGEFQKGLEEGKREMAKLQKQTENEEKQGSVPSNINPDSPIEKKEEEIS